MDSGLTCSRQKYLFSGVSRERQTLENLTQLQQKECRVLEITQVRKLLGSVLCSFDLTYQQELEAAKQDLWDFRYSLTESQQQQMHIAVSPDLSGIDGKISAPSPLRMSIWEDWAVDETQVRSADKNSNY